MAIHYHFKWYIICLLQHSRFERLLEIEKEEVGRVKDGLRHGHVRIFSLRSLFFIFSFYLYFLRLALQSDIRCLEFDSPAHFAKILFWRTVLLLLVAFICLFFHDCKYTRLDRISHVFLSLYLLKLCVRYHHISFNLFVFLYLSLSLSVVLTQCDLRIFIQICSSILNIKQQQKRWCCRKSSKKRIAAIRETNRPTDTT